MRERASRARSRYPRRSPRLEPRARYAIAGRRPGSVDFLFLVVLFRRLFAFFQLVVVEIGLLRLRGALLTELRRVLVGNRLEQRRAPRGTRRGRRRVVGLGVLLVRSALGTDRVGLTEVVELRVAVEALVLFTELGHFPLERRPNLAREFSGVNRPRPRFPTRAS